MAKVKEPKATPGKKRQPQPDETGGGDDSRETPRKKLFAQRIVAHGQPRLAYYEAGYTGDADKKAYRLLKDRVVMEEIERLYSTMELDSLVTARYVIANIRRAADLTGQTQFNRVLGTVTMLDVSSHLRANEMLGKYLGIFREKVDLGDDLLTLLGKVPDPAGSKAT